MLQHNVFQYAMVDDCTNIVGVVCGLQEENRKMIEGDEALAWMASVQRVCLNYYFIIIVATESRFVERVANFRINTHATSSAISS